MAKKGKESEGVDPAAIQDTPEARNSRAHRAAALAGFLMGGFETITVTSVMSLASKGMVYSVRLTRDEPDGETRTFIDTDSFAVDFLQTTLEIMGHRQRKIFGPVIEGIGAIHGEVAEAFFNQGSTGKKN